MIALTSLTIKTKCDVLRNNAFILYCCIDGTAFRFGPKNGFILYKWVDSYPSPRSDTFTLGFSTFQTNAVLMRVLGSKVHNKQNFLELYIVSTNVVACFILVPREIHPGRENAKTSLLKSCRPLIYYFKDEGIPLSAFRNGTTSKLAGLFSMLSL